MSGWDKIKYVTTSFNPKSRIIHEFMNNCLSNTDNNIMKVVLALTAIRIHTSNSILIYCIKYFSSLQFSKIMHYCRQPKTYLNKSEFRYEVRRIPGKESKSYQ